MAKTDNLVQYCTDGDCCGLLTIKISVAHPAGWGMKKCDECGAIYTTCQLLRMSSLPIKGEPNDG